MREELKKLNDYLLKTDPEFVKISKETDGMSSQEIAELYHINMDMFEKQAI